jgi:hypothetical protein
MRFRGLGRDRRTDPAFMVAGGRFELYIAYPIRVPAVQASVIATG